MRVMFIEYGMGLDLHGQNATVAAERVDAEQVKQVFPYGQVTVQIVPGGMLCASGIVLPEHGDSKDLVIIVNAAVEVGY
ncbi:MAG: Lin0512 family protein [Aphanocapsa lilacina HA4352-LM1]|jgi:uncharacterized protein (TIGR02058 family)|nr:Lin0512 family protein [Aphanocapsa lilacina HA4352-LM1]